MLATRRGRSDLRCSSVHSRSCGGDRGASCPDLSSASIDRRRRPVPAAADTPPGSCRRPGGGLDGGRWGRCAAGARSVTPTDAGVMQGRRDSKPLEQGREFVGGWAATSAARARSSVRQVGAATATMPSLVLGRWISRATTSTGSAVQLGQRAAALQAPAGAGLDPVGSVLGEVGGELVAAGGGQLCEGPPHSVTVGGRQGGVGSWRRCTAALNASGLSAATRRSS